MSAHGALVDANPTPFSEPPWLCGIPSPYYNASHYNWQRTCREYITEHLGQHAVDWERAEEVPSHVYGQFARDRMLIPNLPAPLPVKWLKRLGIDELRGGLKVEDFDYMHVAIYIQEMSRSGTGGPAGSLTVGLAYGLPPIFKFGSQDLQERFVPDIILGRKRICIAITEPDAGSDVANIQTSAIRDGDEYVVNGTKKWITNGLWSDYATMAVRTGAPDSGAAGISLLIVPLLNHPGVSMRRIHILGGRSSGTTYIELDDVRVPASNLLGKEGHGMSMIMTNFNHERLSIAIGATAQARTALSAAFRYTTTRRAFNAPLISQPVVRNRLARAGASLESLHSWLESFTYSMIHLPKTTADIKLGGLTALAKAKAGMVLSEVATCAVLLLGGNGLTQGGRGGVVEMVYREAVGPRVPGGSEDVLLDLCVKQLVKNFERAKVGVEGGIETADTPGPAAKL